MTDEDFRTVFRHHKDAVYRFVWRWTGSPACAEDITQDVFLVLLRGSGSQGRSAQELRSFLLGIARNLVLKRWREEKRWTTLEEDCFLAEPLPIDQLQTSEAIASAIGSLPPLQREVLILSTYEGLSLQELMTVTGAELSTVKARLHRARENLKRMLAPWKPVHCRRSSNPYGTAER
jgi:RNA polymerase sigma-70 factor (ECF subfamily)